MNECPISNPTTWYFECANKVTTSSVNIHTGCVRIGIHFSSAQIFRRFFFQFLWEKQFDISHFNTRYDSLDTVFVHIAHEMRSIHLRTHVHQSHCAHEGRLHKLKEKKRITEGDIFLPFVCKMLHKNAIIKCNKIKFQTQFILLCVLFAPVFIPSVFRAIVCDVTLVQL